MKEAVYCLDAEGCQHLTTGKRFTICGQRLKNIPTSPDFVPKNLCRRCRDLMLDQIKVAGRR